MKNLGLMQQSLCFLVAKVVLLLLLKQKGVVGV